VNSIIMQRQREERERGESNTTTTQLSLPAGGYQSVIFSIAHAVKACCNKKWIFY
jgi:hypothetical protein